MRRAAGALSAVAALAILGGLLVFWTRESPYRGRIAARAPGVELTRDGKSLSLRTLEMLDLRAGDVVRTGPEGSALLGWAAGPEAIIGAGTEIKLLSGPTEIELRSGRLRLTAEAAAVALVLSKRRYAVRGREVLVSPEKVEAAGGPAEITPAGAAPLKLEPGASSPWP